MSSVKYVSLLSLALVFVGCTKEKIIERQAPVDIRQSFSVEQLCEKTNCIQMKKSSMGKIYMLMSSGRSTGSSPQWIDLKPQLVSFERSGDQVALLEENYQSVYEEITARDLIQSFSIVAEDEESLTFNWGNGPKTLVFESPYDVAGPDRDPEEEDSDFATANRQYYPVVDAYTQNVGVLDGKLQINQIVKIRYQDSKKGNIDESLNMNFQLIPYNPSPNFVKKEADPQRHVGFFVSKLNKKGYSKTQISLINHWDLEKPITIAVSKSVPDQFVGAIQEGALYWNKVFGKDVVQVVTGVDPASNPKERTIIIRWVPWLDAGAAYAISQADPLTGEILRGQVFLPTIFTRVGSADLVASNGGAPTLMSKVAVQCDLTQRLMQVNKLAREADDSKRLKLAQDSVRSTVAHELGHALGMRHNFAASYSAKVSTKEIYESIANYFKDPDHKGLETTTSIMDYVGGIDDILMSARLKHAPLSYDKMAMEYVYKGTPASQQTSFFCTDEDISLAAQNGRQIYGCARFDAGNNPLYRAYLDAKDEKDNLVKVLYTSILGRYMPGDQPGVKKDLDQVLAETKVWVQANLQTLKTVNEVLFDLSSAQGKSGRYVSLEKHLESPEKGQAEGADPALDVTIATHLKEAGGFNGMLQNLVLTPDGKLDILWFERQLQDLMAKDFYRKGKTLSGREYDLSDEEIASIQYFFEDAIAANMIVVPEFVASFMFPAKDIRNQKGQLLDIVPRDFVKKNLVLDAQFIKAWLGLDEELVPVEYGDKDVKIRVATLPAELRESIFAFASKKVMGPTAAQNLKVQFLAEVYIVLDATFEDLGIAPTEDRSPLAYKQKMEQLSSQLELPEDLKSHLNAEIGLLQKLQAVN